MSGDAQRMYGDGLFFPIVYSMKELDKAIDCKGSNVVLLGRVLNILNSKRFVQYVKARGKMAIIDIDLVGGLHRDEYALSFAAKEVGADGIISMHKSTIIGAKKKKLITILKAFVYDEHSLISALQIIEQCEPDVVELLPGAVLPLILKRVKETTDVPIDASGFFGTTRSDMLKLKELGVSAIHTGEPKLWEADMSFHDEDHLQ